MLMLLCVHVTRVLFLVLVGNFALRLWASIRVTHSYSSYPFLCALASTYLCHLQIEHTYTCTSFMISTLVCLFRWGLAGQPSPFYFQSFGDILSRPLGVVIYGFTNLILEQPSSNHLGRTYVCGVDVQGGNRITTNTTVTAPRKCNLSQSTPMILLIRTIAMNFQLYPSWSKDTSLSRAYILVQMVSILWLYTEHSEFQVVFISNHLSLRLKIVLGIEIRTWMNNQGKLRMHKTSSYFLQHFNPKGLQYSTQDTLYCLWKHCIKCDEVLCDWRLSSLFVPEYHTILLWTLIFSR